MESKVNIVNKIERVNPNQIDKQLRKRWTTSDAEELLAFPNETVYGLGGDALTQEAALQNLHGKRTSF